MTSTRPNRSYVLPLGFAMTVSMWAAAYVCRLPAVMAPSWLVLGLMLAIVALWGWATGFRTGGGWLAGVMVGAAAAVLNMLILGSILASVDGGGVAPSALWWVPGSILVIALVRGASRSCRAVAWSMSPTPPSGRPCSPRSRWRQPSCSSWPAGW